MAVPDQTPYNIYTANGVTTIFPYEFYLINAGDLTVSLDGEVVSTGFTVTGIDNVNGGEVTFLTPPANGVIVMLERVVAPVRLTEYQDNGDLLADTVNLDFDRLWMAIKQSFVSLGFALLRPASGGPFSAKGHRIASLADPVNDQDAATKGYANTLAKKTNQHIETLNNATNNRALRVPEAVIPPIPDAATRAGKLLSFDALGAPIAALPPTGTAADVLTELAKSDGATKIGSQQPDGKSETVQQALSAIRKAVENKLDIGGAVDTLVSRGRVPALSGKNQGTPGIQLYEAYNNGYPTPYGNVIHLKGASSGGEGELLIGWSGTSISGAHAPLYIRSRRDVGNAPWSAWAQVFTANELAGIPLPFPGAIPPSGWLKCNGQAFNKTTYPVLASLYPTGKLPDLRGEFIRGWDDGRKVDTGRSLLSAQNDAMQPITAKWVLDDQAADGGINYPPSGALYIDSTATVNYDAVSSRHRGGARGVFDSSRQTRTANETRPRNIAFNYIVRAA